MSQHRLTGHLATMSLPDLLQWAGRAGKTGSLALRRDQLHKRILFLDGAIVGSSSNDPRDYLGQVLLSEGAITETQLKEAIEEQKRSGTMLGMLLVRQGVVSEARVATILRQKAEETVYSLFLWDDADFEFADGQRPPADQVVITISVEGVLMEGLRRYDTSRRIREVLPHNRLILARGARPLGPEIADRAFPRRVYELVDGRRTIADVILEAHASEFNVSQILFALVQRGHAVIAGEAGPAAGGNAGAAGQACAPGDPLAQARERLNKGDAEEALELLDAARKAGVRSPAMDALTEEAERYFVERAYRHYLPPGKIPILKRPMELLFDESLRPEEVFLVSRVNGTWDLRSIMSISPLREVDALRALKRLRERGVIDLVDPAVQAKAA
jgi:uncharacterized protein DUF4388